MGSVLRRDQQHRSAIAGRVGGGVAVRDREARSEAGGRITLALDDTPEKRYGRHVEGAGVPHDPTPGPAGGEFCYEHNRVSLARWAKHPRWGVIALSLRSWLYVREVDVPRLDAIRGWEFQTKHQLAAQLVTWFVTTLQSWKWACIVWIVVDGTYAARPFLDAALAAEAVVVSRLRKDAALFDLPPTRTPGQRGRPRKFGEKLCLAKRAAHPDGWQSITYHCRGGEVTREDKAFLAMSHLAGKLFRIVLVRFDDGDWVPYFCTDPNATVRDILEAAADRWAIEEHFHDVKEIWGAGQQQVRNVWSNIGCMRTRTCSARWSGFRVPRSVLPSQISTSVGEGAVVKFVATEFAAVEFARFSSGMHCSTNFNNSDSSHSGSSSASTLTYVCAPVACELNPSKCHITEPCVLSHMTTG